MNNTIYSTFADPAMAEKAVGALMDYGVKKEHISVVMPEGYTSSYVSDDEDVDASDTDVIKTEKAGKEGISTTTGADAGKGAVKGAGIGLGVGVLAGLASVFVPGVGLVLGAGALATAIGGAAGATAAGAVAGGVTGYLKDQGVPEDQIANYNNVLKSGGAMVAVTPTDEDVDTAEIQAVLNKYNGTVSAYVA